MTSSAAMNIYFYIVRIYRSLGIFAAIFCLNLRITDGDMKENASGCFFLNTMYKLCTIFRTFQSFSEHQWCDCGAI